MFYLYFFVSKYKDKRAFCEKKNRVLYINIGMLHEVSDTYATKFG